MVSRKRFACGLLSLLACAPSLSWAASQSQLFAQAVRQDAEGHAHLAYLLYRRAAATGLPDAEFNVAVMLDSGRGVTADIAEAATWYARAATHGNRRAAFNLGQLYEAGEGVPKTIALARAWYATSRLPAARARLAAARNRVSRGTALKPPTLVAPAVGERLKHGSDGIEFVWTAQPQPEPVRYRIEVRPSAAPGARDVFAASLDVSAVLAALPERDGSYAWRVLAVAPRTGRSAASAWQQFTVART